MMEYRSLDKIVEQISFYITQLNSGKLAALEIDALLQEVQQLQERLIILRYKAFEATMNEETPIVSEDEVRMETPISFSMTPQATAPAAPEPAVVPVIEVNPKQVSLMDVINEALQNTPEATSDLSSVLQQASAVQVPTLSLEPEEIAPEMFVEPATPEAAVASMRAPEPMPEIPNLIQQAPSSSPSLKTIADEVALGEKLHKTAIGDLSKAIPLGQKFIFINELFHQNADDYHASIDQLNKFDEMEEAMLFVKNNLMPLYHWKQEDKNVDLFLDLVERRFL